MSSIIRSVASYVPSRRMSNDELATIVDTSDEWIFSHTGIRSRHIAADNEAASDLAREAGLLAIERAEIAPDDIDLILLATSTPDYVGLPSTACVVQNMLGAGKAGAMDLVAACTGFIYGLQTARAYIDSGSARHVLVIGSEVYSRLVNWKDRSSCVLFGDGAGAAVVSHGEDKDRGIIDAFLRSQGSGAPALLKKAGGSRLPIGEDTEEADRYLYMDGRRVYVFAVNAIIEVVRSLLHQNGLSFDDVDYVVPHQANVRIIEAACKRAGWDSSKFFVNIAEYANTSAASIPIALDEMRAKGLLKPGMTILTVGFGSGLTYGGNLIRW